MECCCSRTGSLWYGSWNRHVCRKGKCASDRPFRSTGVNPSRKQKWCSLPCFWSQVQRDTSDPDNSENLGYWLTIRHRCICMWSWTEMLTFSFQFRAKTVWSLLRWVQKMSARRGAQNCEKYCVLYALYPAHRHLQISIQRHACNIHLCSLQ